MGAKVMHDGAAGGRAGMEDGCEVGKQGAIWLRELRGRAAERNVKHPQANVRMIHDTIMTLSHMHKSSEVWDNPLWKKCRAGRTGAPRDILLISQCNY